MLLQLADGSVALQGAPLLTVGGGGGVWLGVVVGAFRWAGE